MSTPSRVNTRTSMTVPSMPGGTRSDVSFTSRRLLAEDGAQQFLFRRELGFALRRDLAHEDVAGAHFGADERDAGFVELGQRRVTHVRDVGGDFLRAQLGVAGDAGQLFDVDRGETIFLHHAFADEDRVFEVVAVPRHERDQQVLAERELAEIRRRSIRQHVAARDVITGVHQRTLVDAGVLVRARVLGQAVDVDARLRSRSSRCRSRGSRCARRRPSRRCRRASRRP